MKTLDNINILDLQTDMINALSDLSGEEVVRAFINWHGRQLLTKDFAKNLIEEGYLTESDLGIDAIDEDDYDEDEDEDEDDYSCDEDEDDEDDNE